MKASPKCYQKVLALGFMGRDVIYRKMPNGQAKAVFDIAVSRSWKDKNTDEWQETTFWYHCEAWRYLAERASKFKQGDKVWAEGVLELQTWKDKETGEDRERVVMKVADCWLESAKFKGAAQQPATDSDDDTPF